MREIRSLIWKEWHETRLFLWIAWGLFIGLPIIAGLEGVLLFSQPFRFYASPWVMILTPVMAIVVGVAATCRDLKPGLEDFWQSRPLGGIRLFAVKYLVGMSAILLACGVPLVVECFAQHNRTLVDVACEWVGLSLLLLPLFSMAFASGCLFHKPAHAAAVVVVGTLLICFLPIVFPPLERFSVGGVLDENALEIAAVSGLLGIAIVTALLGLLSVRFHWHIESGKPLIYGAICSGFLVLALSASYQLGTNLPVISTTELPKGEVAEYVEVGKASTSVYLLPVGADGQPSRSAAERLLMLSNDSLGLGAVSPIDDRRPTAQSARNERDPSIIYNLWMEWEADRQVWQLAVLRNPGIHEFSNIATIDLWIAPENDWTDRAGYFDQFSDRLNVIVGKRLIVFDVSDPPRPRKITDEAFPWQLSDENIGEDVAVPLPPVPGLPGEERLKFLGNIMNLSSSRRFDGRNLLLFSEPAFEVLRLKSVNDDRALFRRAGRYTPTIVQSIAVHNSASRRGIVNGMLYAETGNLLSVFDISRDGPVKLIAHFAAPGVQFYQPLPDGRVLAGGSKIWLLGPPPKH